MEMSLFLAAHPGRGAEGSDGSACSCQEMEQDTTPRDLSHRASSSLTTSEPMFGTAKPAQGGVLEHRQGSGIFKRKGGGSWREFCLWDTGPGSASILLLVQSHLSSISPAYCDPLQWDAL